MLLLALGLAFVASGTVPMASAQTLSDELRRLVRDHPQIEAARKLKRAGESREREAFGEFLPRAEISGESGPERVDNRTITARDGEFTDRRDRLRFAVTQNIFNGFGDEARMRAAQHGTAVLDATLDATTQSVLLEGVSAYLNVLRERKLIDVAGLNEANIQNQLQLEDERVRRGVGISVDVLQAKSRLQIAKERRVAFEGRLRAAAARYRQVFDSTPDPAVMQDVRPPPDLIPASLEDALATAYATNPNARATDYTARVNDARREIARSEYYPTLDVVGSALYENNADGVEGSKRTYSLYLRSRWEFFSGLTTRSRVDTANRTYEASRDTLLHTRRKVDEEVRIAWENLRTQRERVALLENAVAIAHEVLDARRRLREVGKETALNVLDAEGEVFAAQINMIEADYDSRIAIYRLLFAIGLLNEQTLGLDEG